MQKYCLYCCLLFALFTSTIVFCQTETLEECEKSGKKFCNAPSPSEEESDQINQLIESNPKLLAKFLKFRQEHENPYEIRHKRTAVKVKDCDSICCSTVEDSDPFSYYRDVTGWETVANTTEFPQRVAFQIVKCESADSPCRGVKSTYGTLRPVCTEIKRTHKIFLYDKQTRTIKTRYLDLPSGCVCKLRKNPFSGGKSEGSNGDDK